MQTTRNSMCNQSISTLKNNLIDVAKTAGHHVMFKWRAEKRLALLAATVSQLIYKSSFGIYYHIKNEHGFFIAKPQFHPFSSTNRIKFRN